MNNRIRKKIVARRRNDHGEREELHKLLDLVLDINGLGERRQEISGNLPTAFFGFNGHTAGAYVQVYNKGWNGLDDPDFSVYSWDFQGIDNYIKALESASAKLRPVSYH